MLIYKYRPINDDDLLGFAIWYYSGSKQLTNKIIFWGEPYVYNR